MQEFTAKIKQMLLLNECSGNTDLIYKFSDADGVRTGRSGYSYGVSQFDIENNWDAILTLMDCGFQPKDLKRLYLQQGDISDLNLILESSADYIDEADDRHIADMIRHCNTFNAIDDDLTVAMIIDYHNQLRLESSADYVDEADDRLIADMIKHCNIFNAIDDDSTLAMIIDYHNQLRFDIGGKLHRFLLGMLVDGREIDANTIYQFKLNHTLWGQKRPDDVERRYKNTLEVFCG